MYLQLHANSWRNEVKQGKIACGWSRRSQSRKRYMKSKNIFDGTHDSEIWIISIYLFINLVVILIQCCDRRCISLKHI